VLSLEEEVRLRSAIRELYPSREPELDLLLHTGARCSNWYGIEKKGRTSEPALDWSAIDLKWKLVKFPRSKTSEEGYQVPLNSVAVGALELLKKRSGGVGPVITEGRSCRQWFEKSCEKAEITGLRPHDLRHTFATRLRQNRVHLEDIARLLGHDLERHAMTARYAHEDLDILREAVESLVPTKTETDTNTDTGTVIAFPQAAAV
jgi:integrase